MARPFSTTPHSDIVRALEAESRQHTFVERRGDDLVKRYEMRLTGPELLSVLDSLSFTVNRADRIRERPGLVEDAHRLRLAMLQTLGLLEEG